MVANAAEAYTCKPDSNILELGSDDPYSYFLLSGRVELTAADGGRLKVEAESERARNPLSDLRPRKYAVKALGKVYYLKIESSLLHAISAHDPSADSVLVHAMDQPTELRPAVQHLWERIRSDLENDLLQIPTLPDVATRIGQILHKTSTDAKQIANVVALDPAMAAKLLKASNSPVYGGLSPTASLADAVMRLGFDMTHNLVISYALGELYKPRSRLIRNEPSTTDSPQSSRR